MNVIARLENELAYYDSAIHRFNHYTTRTPPSHNKYAYIHIYMFMQDTYWCNKLIRCSNKRRRKTSLTKYLPLTLLQGFEKVVWGFTMRGCWRLNITEIFWPQTYGHHVVSFLFFWCSTGALGSPLLGAGFLYCILSASSLDPNSSGPQAPSAWCGFPYHISPPTVCNSTGTGWNSNSSGPQGPFSLMWLSLPHLVYNWPETPTPLACRTQLSYIIVQRPLDLWNQMFNHHQAEITVMQFRGHSLPVHQSMRVSWDFFYLVPFHQPISAHAISSHNCH